MLTLFDWAHFIWLGLTPHSTVRALHLSCFFLLLPLPRNHFYNNTESNHSYKNREINHLHLQLILLMQQYYYHKSFSGRPCNSLFFFFHANSVSILTGFSHLTIDLRRISINYVDQILCVFDFGTAPAVYASVLCIQFDRVYCFDWAYIWLGSPIWQGLLHDWDSVLYNLTGFTALTGLLMHLTDGLNN